MRCSNGATSLIESAKLCGVEPRAYLGEATRRRSGTRGQPRCRAISSSQKPENRVIGPWARTYRTSPPFGIASRERPSTEGSVMVVLVFVVSLTLIWLIGCAAWSIRFPERRLWPPLRREGLLYRVNSVLGPSISAALILVSILGWNSLEIAPWLRFPVGGTLFALGAYFSLGGYFSLGVERTFGFEGELLDSGPYRFSRNPQYVGAMLVMGGLGLLCNSAPGLATALLASVWWLILPFAEEPWLREKLGAPYEAYAARVPRYLPLFRMPRRLE